MIVPTCPKLPRRLQPWKRKSWTTTLVVQLALLGKGDRTLLSTHSLPLRRETLGRGTPAAPGNAYLGPSWSGRQRRGQGAGDRGASRWGPERSARGEPASPGAAFWRLRSRGASERARPRGSGSRGRRGPPAPSPQPVRGSDNEDISRKLFGAGGRARGECWRPSKHCGDTLPCPSPNSSVSFPVCGIWSFPRGRGSKRSKNLQRARVGGWVTERPLRTEGRGYLC